MSESGRPDILGAGTPARYTAPLAMSRKHGTPEVWSASPDEVRARFLEFFRARGHEILPSASLVPENDPSLLFIGAGMAPFKDHFLGRVPLTFRRAATSQKCLRTGDLENVGRTPGHHTFFEMLGNFSFGDYFKEDAIRWAWEFLTVDMAIPAERLRVTVYRDDDEAAGHWTKVAGIPADRIGRLGAKSNFWPANAPEDGPDGPCGPCSEIFFDLGFKPDPAVACSVPGCPDVPGSPDCDCRRFLEVWNLVFQQFDRKGRNELVPLAMQNIDTGMGFERLLTVLAHLEQPDRRVYSNFETALFVPIVEVARRIAGYAVRGSDEFEVRARRVADHMRAAVFCVADGVRPSNEGRGYVLRRVIRRAVRDHLKMQWTLSPHLHEFAAVVAEVMSGAYPDLRSNSRDIASVIRAEEERFRETYEQGTRLFDRRVAEVRAARRTVFPGEALFELYDTYGFPADLAVDQLREMGLEPDLSGFEALMARRRKESREASKLATDIFAAGPLERVKKEQSGTAFLGYGPNPEGPGGTYEWDSGVEGESTVAEILVGDRPVDRMEPGQEGALVLRETPFYAEQGGQVGDAGEIRSPGGAVFRVRDTQKVEGFHLHLGILAGGPLSRGDRVRAVVDHARRDAIRRNHTGTHLLHRVLKVVLGEDARQAGSLVAPDYLRFDFTWPRAMTAEEKARVEAEVNRRIREDHPVKTRVHTLEEARATGAVSMFGEKYGSRVRVLTAGDSLEFCGGTHCRATGDIQEFRIVSEKSIGSGIRRIEAVTGTEAVAVFERERSKAAQREDEERRRRAEAKAAKKEEAKRASAGALGPGAVDQRTVGKFQIRIGKDLPASVHGQFADSVREQEGDLAVFVAVSPQDCSITASGSAAAVKAGFHAGKVVALGAKVLGGGGGGKPAFAQGKGKDSSRIPEAIAAIEEYLRNL